MILWCIRTEPYVERTELCVGVLVVDPLLKRAHRLLGLYRLGTYDVGDLEVEGDILAAEEESQVARSERGRRRMTQTYRLLLVAFSICSSRAVFAPEDHQLIILTTEGTAITGRLLLLLLLLVSGGRGKIGACGSARSLGAG